MSPPATATLERGSRTVDIPLIEEAGAASPTRAVGLPSHEIHEDGRVNPRSGIHNHSVNEQIQFSTRLYDGDIAIAHDVADMIKAHSGGQPITLNVPFQEFDNDMLVIPAAEQDTALEIEFPAGAQYCNLSLTLTRVGQLLGTDSSKTAPTPRAPGSGPITLSSTSQSVEFATGSVTVTREVGQPNLEASRRPAQQFPTATDKRGSASDIFEITLEHLTDPSGKISRVLDLVRTLRGRETLTLEFNGTYGMGGFNVMPSGSNAFRHVRVAGRKGSEHQRMPALKLRVVR